MFLSHQSSLTFVLTETYQSSPSPVSLLPSPSVRTVPASVFLHIIAIRRQAVCKHDAAFAIGLFVQIVPLSVHMYPAAFHAGLRINIEPAAINAVADPSGHCVAILVESPPVSIDKNPLMCNSNCIISGCSCTGAFAAGCSLRIGSVFVEELICSFTIKIIGTPDSSK